MVDNANNNNCILLWALYRVAGMQDYIYKPGDKMQYLTVEYKNGEN